MKIIGMYQDIRSHKQSTHMGPYQPYGQVQQSVSPQARASYEEEKSLNYPVTGPLVVAMAAVLLSW